MVIKGGCKAEKKVKVNYYNVDENIKGFIYCR